ncbi:hypothetical protein [Nostoc sp. MS1]|uniref:hypothetical protein n=1 Tax=Nostoc sp. MS1 TaxID=2764711 RepID=UPI001CC69650|nr:hypothetical protein [Nostoc sp. MS1]BCL34248.1 hypothetical protein NSMS1_06950 [Nostoc sp. MS1]
MEFQYQEVNQGYTSPDFLFNFEPGGQVSPRYNAPPPPGSVENLTAEYLLKQQQLSDAVRNQHKIDNLYERIMNEAPRRDVEVLPPETPGEFFDPNRTRMKNITPVDQAQEIAELLERQTKRPATVPTTAEPPAVPNYKTIPLTDPLATPPTYTPRTPVGGGNPAPTAKPRGLPTPAGRFAAPLVGGAIDAGFRLAAGQPAGQALAGAAASTAGSLVGATLGAGLGPVGMFVGGIVGGFVGGAIADVVYNAAFPTPAQPQPVPYSAPAPFYGGQEPDRMYSVNGAYISSSGNLVDLGDSPWLPGPIGGMFKGIADNKFGIGVYHGNSVYFFTSLDLNETSLPTAQQYYESYVSPLILDITPQDGLPDPGNPPAPAPPPDNRPYEFQSGGESDLAPPTGTPGAPKPPTNYAPGSTTPKGTPRGDSSNFVPHGFPAPKLNPNPNFTPSNLGGNFPGLNPNPAPTPNPPGLEPFNFKLLGPPSNPTPGGSGTPTPLTPPQSTPGGFPQPIPNPSPPDKNKDLPPTVPIGTGNPNPPTPTPTTSPTTGTPISTDICESPCIKSLEAASIFWVDLQVPVISCEQDETGIWTPKTSSQTIKVIATFQGNEILKSQTQFQELAKINTELCNAKNGSDNAILTLPERYQIPVDGHIPQIIYVFREVRDDGTWGERMYPMTVPHPKSINPPEQRPLPDYKKGSWELILTLKDNTKVFINALSMEECQTMIDQVKPLIADAFLESSSQKIGQRKGQQLLEIKVRIFKVDYFEKGTKNAKPKWSKYFR